MSFMIVLLASYLGDEIKENEVGSVCGIHEREEQCILGFGGRTSGKETAWNTWAQKGGY
jgi:hypothetical protein